MSVMVSTESRCPLCMRFLFDVGRARTTCKPTRDDEDCFEAGYHYWRSRAEWLQRELARTPADTKREQP